jgi:hypothetical protein
MVDGEVCADPAVVAAVLSVDTDEEAELAPVADGPVVTPV